MAKITLKDKYASLRKDFEAKEIEFLAPIKERASLLFPNGIFQVSSNDIYHYQIDLKYKLFYSFDWDKFKLTTKSLKDLQASLTNYKFSMDCVRVVLSNSANTITTNLKNKDLYDVYFKSMEEAQAAIAMREDKIAYKRENSLPMDYDFEGNGYRVEWVNGSINAQNDDKNCADLGHIQLSHNLGNCTHRIYCPKCGYAHLVDSSD